MPPFGMIGKAACRSIADEVSQQVECRLRPKTRPTVKAGQAVLPPAATLRPGSGFVLGKCVCREGPLRVVWRPDSDPDLSGFPPDADVDA